MEAPRCAPGRTWSVTRVTGRSGKTAGSRVVSRGCLPSEQRTKSPKIKHLTEWYTPLKESDQLCQLGRLDNPVRLSALWSDWHFRSTLWEKKKNFFFLLPSSRFWIGKFAPFVRIFESGRVAPFVPIFESGLLLPLSRFLNRDVCTLRRRVCSLVDVCAWKVTKYEEIGKISYPDARKQTFCHTGSRQTLFYFSFVFFFSV